MFLLTNANVFDGVSEELIEGIDVLIEDNSIREVGSGLKSSGAHTIDLSGHTLLPGLIDAHVHVYAADLDLTRNMRRPWTYLAHYANRFLSHCLRKGFTTVRDVGGADYGLALALQDGHLSGPRLFYGGRILSQTGGHADWRPQFEDAAPPLCTCSALDQKLSVVVDGNESILRAVREELRRGAHHVKILASGGVASPSDSVDGAQYSDDEIRLVVAEGERHGAYVAAHCHSAESVRRCAALGVRSIEHATLIDEPTASAISGSRVFVVPTMAVIYAFHDDGARLGLPAASVVKLKKVFGHALGSLEIMKRAGLTVGFGTDLLGPLYSRQWTEFKIRSEIFSPVEILRQATSINAELLNMKGRLGTVAPGAYADLIAVRGNPLRDLNVLASQDASPAFVMKDGRVAAHSGVH